MTERIAASELPLNKAGKVYHLDLGPDDIADTIILVGDPGRVELVGSYFDSIRFSTVNREFATITGAYGGKEFSVISTGIGTDNVDIVINEIDAAVNIDLKTGKEKTEKRKLQFIRIGTCGALHEEIDPGSFIVSSYALGLDGVAHFYLLNFTDEETDAMVAFYRETGWSENLNAPYIKACAPALRKALGDGFIDGITITANGFYGPQGRVVRLQLSHPDFKEDLRSFSWKGIPVANLEMESSALYALAHELGHEAITVCMVLANRYSNKFLTDYKLKMKELIELVLHKISS